MEAHTAGSSAVSEFSLSLLPADEVQVPAGPSRGRNQLERRTGMQMQKGRITRRERCPLRDVHFPQTARSRVQAAALPAGPQELLVGGSLVALAGGALTAALRPSAQSLEECGLCQRTGTLVLMDIG